MKKSIKSIGLGLLGGIIPLGVFLMVENGSMFNNGTSHQIKIEQSATSASTVGLDSDADGPLKTDFTTAAEGSVKSVVHVKTKIVQQYTQQNPFLDFFGGPGSGNRTFKRYGRASGSGVIVSEDGYILTNNHVIENAKSIEVTLDNNKTYKASVVGADPATDIAVIKIDAKGLRPMPIGNSDNLKVGQWVLAVGNPFNLTSTVTAGIISAKGRNINLIGRDDKNIMPIESFIQTDAAVNPGNSGGALVNTAGQLVGINTAIASQTGNYAGYSFAVPSKLAVKVMNDLMKYGVVQRAFLGIKIQPITQKLMDDKDIHVSDGIYVASVNKGSAAGKAGIKEGDVITKIGSKELNTVPALQREIGERRPGDKVTLTVLRKGKEITKNVTLRGKDGSTKLTSKEEIDAHSALGATFTKITNDDKKELNINSGVKIASITAGKLKSAGLTKDMIITKVNNQVVTSVKQLTEILNNKTEGGVLLEVLSPSGQKNYIGFGL